MAIEYRPTGEAQAVSQAGKQTGQAEAAKRQQQLTLEQQAEDRARAWEVEKFVLNSQQDFAHEMRLRQAELNKEARAHEWEVEKAEIASRMDFEQQEKERIRDKATFNAGIKAIDDNEGLTDAQRDAAKFNLATKYTHIPEAAQYLGLKQTTTLTSEEQAKAERIAAGLEPRAKAESEVGQYLQQILGGAAQSTTETGTVLVRNNKGIYGTIPVSQVEEAIANGYTVVNENQLVSNANKSKYIPGTRVPFIPTKSNFNLIP